MRLDKYLKVARIIKRRTIANEACDAGRVLLSDKVANASLAVTVRDIIQINLGNNSIKIKVLEVKDIVRKEEAINLYENI